MSAVFSLQNRLDDREGKGEGHCEVQLVALLLKTGILSPPKNLIPPHMTKKRGRGVLNHLQQPNLFPLLGSITDGILWCESN